MTGSPDRDAPTLNGMQEKLSFYFERGSSGNGPLVLFTLYRDDDGSLASLQHVKTVDFRGDAQNWIKHGLNELVPCEEFDCHQRRGPLDVPCQHMRLTLSTSPDFLRRIKAYVERQYNYIKVKHVMYARSERGVCFRCKTEPATERRHPLANPTRCKDCINKTLGEEEMPDVIDKKAKFWFVFNDKFTSAVSGPHNCEGQAIAAANNYAKSNTERYYVAVVYGFAQRSDVIYTELA
jgi:hypothetical protein